jgi:hypothetical protein
MAIPNTVWRLGLATKALRWVRPESVHLGSALENAMGDDGFTLVVKQDGTLS